MRQPVPIADRTAFLSLLFDAAGASLVEFRALPSMARTFASVDELDDADAFLADHEHEDKYFGVASRRDASSGRLENCDALGALFVDVDYKVLGENAARE